MASGEAKLPGSTAGSLGVFTITESPVFSRTLCRRRCNIHPPGSRTGPVPSSGSAALPCQFPPFRNRIPGRSGFSGRCSTTSTGVPSRRYFIQAAGRGFQVWALTWVSCFPTPAHQASRLVEYPPKLLKHQLVQLLAGRPILLFPVQAQLF